jgi:hypothetical protein
MENNLSAGGTPLEAQVNLLVYSLALTQLHLGYFEKARPLIEEDTLVLISNKYAPLFSKKWPDGSRVNSKELRELDKKFKSELRTAKTRLDNLEKATLSYIDALEMQEHLLEDVRAVMLKLNELINNKINNIKK